LSCGWYCPGLSPNHVLGDWIRHQERRDRHIVCLILILTSVLVGLVAVLLYQNKNNLNPRVFLAAALLNAGALLGILCYQQRRKK